MDYENIISFFDERDRLTKNCNIACVECPFYSKNNGMDVGCSRLIRLHTERAVEILQKWSEENPVKTRLDDFKEKYPNHKKNGDGYPVSCCLCLGYAQDCDNECDKCWDMPL